MVKKSRLVPGVPAPSLEAEDLHGQAFSLQRVLQERVAVVVFLRGFL